jgi:hypothetical protein
MMVLTSALLGVGIALASKAIREAAPLATLMAHGLPTCATTDRRAPSPQGLHELHRIP